MTFGETIEWRKTNGLADDQCPVIFPRKLTTID